MLELNKKLLEKITSEAKHSPRKRKNYNFHKEYTDQLQRMLNAINPGSYVQPHKHEAPDKREVFIILQGKMAVFEFDNSGTIKQQTILDTKTGNLGVEIAPGTWHTIVSLEEGSVVYEIKDGPYQPVDDKNFATWAPKENEEGVDEYLNFLLNNLTNE